MVSAFTHGISACAIGALFPAAILPRRAWIAGAVCAAAPDLDAILHWSGVPYESMFGHRGLTHSLCFAAFLGGTVAWLAARRGARHPRALFAYLAACTASHGVLDAMTDGGLGIAFLAPFSAERWFLPWREIEVAPIGIAAFFSEWGWRVIQSEFRWVWLPSLLVIAAATGVHRLRAPRPG